MRVGAVVNPAAGGGRTRQRWPSIRAALEARVGALAVRETDAPGDAPCLAEALVADGIDVVVAVGGDGTISEVADGILKARDETGRDAALAIAPSGTGGDIARILGIPGEPDAIAGLIAGAGERRLDAGRLGFVDDGGCLRFRYFLNIASLGISGAIDRSVNARMGQKGKLGGKAVFYFHTVRELLRYRFPEVSIVIDDEDPVTARIALVAVANGPSFGGGMLIAPDAVNTDGLFDIVVVRGAGRLGLVRNLGLIYSGAHVSLPIVTVARGRKVTIEPLGDDAPLLDVDGESPGRAPATFEIVPGAIRVRCASG